MTLSTRSAWQCVWARVDSAPDASPSCGSVLVVADVTRAGIRTGAGANEAPAEGLDELTKQLLLRVPTKPRSTEGPFLFAVDHCFPIKGQGTVLTGTVLQGTVSVNQVRAHASLLKRGLR